MDSKEVNSFPVHHSCESSPVKGGTDSYVSGSLHWQGQRLDSVWNLPLCRTGPE